MLAVGDELSRLPGHTQSDRRIRYRVVAEAIKPFEPILILYEDRTGNAEWEAMDIVAVIASAYDPQKLYISGLQGEAPRNLFCGGVQAIEHPQTKKLLSLNEGLAQLFTFFDS